MDLEKRKFLRTLFLGGTVLFIGKILGPVLGFSGLKSNTKTAEVNLFDNLRKVEKENEIIFYDKKGEKVLVIEKA